MDQVGALPFQKLKIQPDRKDKKALEISTTPIPMLKQGAVGTPPKDSLLKLDTVPGRAGWNSSMQTKDADRRGEI